MWRSLQQPPLWISWSRATAVADDLANRSKRFGSRGGRLDSRRAEVLGSSVIPVMSANRRPRPVGFVARLCIELVKQRRGRASQRRSAYSRKRCPTDFVCTDMMLGLMGLCQGGEDRRL